MQQADTLIDAGWIVPVEDGPSVLPRHTLVMQDCKVEAILPTADAHARYASARHLQLPGHALIPGLVNLHTHAAMTLMRGLADDLPLMTWLNDHIWPAEARHVSPDFVYQGTRLACAEMLLGGVTCFNDMYFFPDAAARAALDAGMRAVLGMIVIEFPSPYAGDAEDYLHRGLAIRDQYGDEPLLGFSLAPHAPYTISDETFVRIQTYADQLDTRVHIHLHETADEIQGSLAKYGLRPLARLQNLGLPGPNMIAVHAVHLTDDEIETLRILGCHVAHCPTSNLKLASGFAPVTKLLERGVNVGLGTDGAASNNRLDLFGEMRLAALLAKGVAGRADAVPALQALRMATMGGAIALGMEDRIGSLRAGKAADVVAVDLSGIDTQPLYDVVSQLVYAAGREQVTHVWVNGELRVDNRALTALDPRRLAVEADGWRGRMEPDRKGE